MFSLFLGFISKYFEIKENYKGIFRSNNVIFKIIQKVLPYDIIKYLIMFTRDYLQHLTIALEKHLQYEIKDNNRDFKDIK